MGGEVVSKPEKLRKPDRQEKPAAKKVEPSESAENLQKEKIQPSQDRPAIWDGGAWLEKDGTPID
jgi:hypothetical protein